MPYLLLGSTEKRYSVKGKPDEYLIVRSGGNTRLPYAFFTLLSSLLVPLYIICIMAFFHFAA
jgi:hypothetical protein